MTESPSIVSGGSLPSFVLTALLYIERSLCPHSTAIHLHVYRSIYSNKAHPADSSSSDRCFRLDCVLLEHGVSVMFVESFLPVGRHAGPAWTMIRAREHAHIYLQDFSLSFVFELSGIGGRC